MKNRIEYKMIRAIVFVLLLLATPSFGQVCFQNFNQNLCGAFRLSQEVVLKTTLSKRQLMHKLGKKVTTLARLHDSNLFLIASRTPLQDAKALAKRSDIIYAQPNLFQPRKKNMHASQGYQPNTKLSAKGVRVAIIDDGFYFGHQDFNATDVIFHYDVEHQILDSRPKSQLDRHGTQVMGVLFSDKIGLIPDASLIAVQNSSTLTSSTVLAFFVAKMMDADVINCSWRSSYLLEPIYDIIMDIITYGRKGLGTAVVFAAGNDGKAISGSEASIDEAVVVGATQKYSSFGKSVDFVLRAGVSSTNVKGGYSYFGGTSSTAPMVSALIAAKIAQKPEQKLSSIIKELKRELDARERDVKFRFNLQR